jgi:hypothetical protein
MTAFLKSTLRAWISTEFFQGLAGFTLPPLISPFRKIYKNKTV